MAAFRYILAAVLLSLLCTTSFALQTYKKMNKNQHVLAHTTHSNLTTHAAQHANMSVSPLSIPMELVFASTYASVNLKWSEKKDKLELIITGMHCAVEYDILYCTNIIDLKHIHIHTHNHNHTHTHSHVYEYSFTCQCSLHSTHTHRRP